MQPESGRFPEPSGETLLPPAFTQWRPLADPAGGPDAPLAPFFPGNSGGGEWEAAPEAAGFPPAEPAPPEDSVFEDAAALVYSGSPEDDAVEEDTLVLFEEVPGVGLADRWITEEVADRLEVLAGRLRQSGLAALDTGSGDAIDTVLAAVLSGYVAARAR